jgi:hypothetical protein
MVFKNIEIFFTGNEKNGRKNSIWQIKTKEKYFK